MTFQVTFVGLVYCLSAMLANFGSAGWTAWMANIVPKSLAGVFFGTRAGFGLFMMSGVGLAASYLADHMLHTTTMYTLVFSIAAVLGATDILLFLPVREIPRPVETPRPSFMDIITTPWSNALFRSFCLYTVVSTIGYGLMNPFQTPFVFACGMSVLSTTFVIIVLPQVSMAVLSPYWGKAIDRFGTKPVLTASALCHVILPVWWVVMCPRLLWSLPILSIVSGLTWPGIDQVSSYMQFKGFPEQRRSTYIAMFLVVCALAGMVGTLAGGALASYSEQHLRYFAHLPSWAHYQPLFALSVVVRLLAFVCIIPRMPLPASGTKRDVAHAIAQDVVKSLPRLPRVK
jgi:MFS family permease